MQEQKHDSEEGPEVEETLASATALIPIHPFQPNASLRRPQKGFRDAFMAGGIGWGTKLVPLMRQDSGTMFREDCYGVVNEKTGKALGRPVTSRYENVTNLQVADTFDTHFEVFGGTALAPVEKILQLRGGEKLVAICRLPDALSGLVSVRGADREAKLALVFGHGGGYSIGALGGSVRIACENGTFKMDHIAKPLYMRHTTSIDDKMKNSVADWMKRLGASMKTEGEMLRHLDSKKVGAAQVVALVGEILDPEQTKSRTVLHRTETLVTLIENRDGQFVPPGDITLYTLLEAFTAWDTNLVPVRGKEAEHRALRRAEKVVDGDGVSHRAMEILMEAAR